MAVYYVFYLIANMEQSTISLKEFLLRMLSASTPESPHYWLMYSIAGLYLAYPFLRYMIKEMPYHMMCKLAIIILLFMGVQLYLPEAGINPGISTFWAGWIGIAFLGYWVTRDESRKYDAVVLASSLVAFLLMVYLIGNSDRASYLITNCTPIMALLSMGIFVIVIRLWKGQDSGMLLSFFSKYSFGVILIHWFVLYFITRAKLGMTIFLYHGMGLILSVCMTVLGCLYMAFFLDNFMVKGIFWIWNRILSIKK